MNAEKDKFDGKEAVTFSLKDDNLLQFHLIPNGKRASEIYITMKKQDPLYDFFTTKTMKIAYIEHDSTDGKKLKDNFAKILNEKIIPNYQEIQKNPGR